MKYDIELEPPVIDLIASKRLADPVLDELERRLADELATQPTRYLRDIVAPVRCMQYNCRIVEPGPPARVHVFLFRVRYSQDERRLIVWSADYFGLNPQG